jgi:hypothetical protein
LGFGFAVDLGFGFAFGAGAGLTDLRDVVVGVVTVGIVFVAVVAGLDGVGSCAGVGGRRCGIDFRSAR